MSSLVIEKIYLVDCTSIQVASSYKHRRYEHRSYFAKAPLGHDTRGQAATTHAQCLIHKSNSNTDSVHILQLVLSIGWVCKEFPVWCWSAVTASISGVPPPLSNLLGSISSNTALSLTPSCCLHAACPLEAKHVWKGKKQSRLTGPSEWVKGKHHFIQTGRYHSSKRLNFRINGFCQDKFSWWLDLCQSS